MKFLPTLIFRIQQLSREGVSQREIARQLGIGKSAAHKYARQTREPSGKADVWQRQKAGRIGRRTTTWADYETTRKHLADPKNRKRIKGNRAFAAVVSELMEIAGK